VYNQWSGKHQGMVQGINRITLLWSDGEQYISCDYRIYDKKNDGLTKNDHFRAMLQEAQRRGFESECVCFDSWYASLDKLKQVRNLGWSWVTKLHPNRIDNPDRKGQKPLRECEIDSQGTPVYRHPTKSHWNVDSSFSPLRTLQLPNWSHLV